MFRTLCHSILMLTLVMPAVRPCCADESMAMTPAAEQAATQAAMAMPPDMPADMPCCMTMPAEDACPPSPSRQSSHQPEQAPLHHSSSSPQAPCRETTAPTCTMSPTLVRISGSQAALALPDAVLSMPPSPYPSLFDALASARGVAVAFGVASGVASGGPPLQSLISRHCLLTI